MHKMRDRNCQSRLIKDIAGHLDHAALRADLKTSILDSTVLALCSKACNYTLDARVNTFTSLGLKRAYYKLHKLTRKQRGKPARKTGFLMKKY